jgi:hypothetical protein
MQADVSTRVAGARAFGFSNACTATYHTKILVHDAARVV